MCSRKRLPLFLIMALAVGLPAFSMTEGRFIRPPTPPTLQSTRDIMSPPMLSSGGDTAWIQVHNDSSNCPGDPLMGHGGEARGGPGPMETWCFEGGPGDSCGTNPPWDVRCFSHEDVRAKPSPMDMNYWHVDTYRAGQRTYCGDYALWCGSDSTWYGDPVECGTWASPPGYGDQWSCVAQLTLPDTFDVANGCTLFFDPRYDTECKYDYFYVDFWDGSEWLTLARFNATSNNAGDECGAPGGGNPDFWGNTDTDRLANVDWQERTDPPWPAFTAGIDAGQYSYTSGPKFRWRFESDGSASDASGVINTDGGAWIDNVRVLGDTDQYEEDFESAVLDPACWSLPDPDGVIDHWHIVHDPDPPYEGGDGGDPAGCSADSSHVYRARPEGGYPVSAEWRNGWYYRLMTPSIPITNSGCVVQYDTYQYASGVSCDYPDELVRFFDTEYGQWCPWINVDYELFWFPGVPQFDANMDVTYFMSDRYDSMQFAWYLVDVSQPGDFCRGKHAGTDLQVDNVSVGFYDADASLFGTRPQDFLHDTFFTGLCGYNAGFDAHDEDTVTYYWHEAHDLPRWNQLTFYVRDTDQISSVELLGSIDEGASWVTLTMTIDFWNYDPHLPRLDGDCYGTLCPSDFGIAEWDTGTAVWYCVKATDDLDNVTYFPAAADPMDPRHTGTAGDYLTFSVLPLYPADYSGARILLVNGYRTDQYSWAYDWAECLTDLDVRMPLVAMYEETLTDAGYCYDVYDIGGAASSMEIHPIWFDDYDAVVWFTGSDNGGRSLIDSTAQYAIRDFLAGGGKLVLCGDRLALNLQLCPPGYVCECGDALDGDFIYGIMGCWYKEEMATPFSKPYIYCDGVDSISVFGTPTSIDFDSLLIYRECPYPRDMSWVRAETSPPMGFTVQPLLDVLNPDVEIAHSAMYTEYLTAGQCVFVNFDLSACVNHEQTYCIPSNPAPPPYNAAAYEGRVELMRLILEDIFGLAPPGGGTAGTGEPSGPPETGHAWALAQNSPNPFARSTEIRYEVAEPCRARIAVYNTRGQVVRVLVDEAEEPGAYRAAWDGRSESGRRVSSGVYFYRIEAGAFTATRKMLILN
jgi:hypothetical protein